MKKKNVKIQQPGFADKFKQQGLTPEQQKQVKGGSFIIIEEVDGA